MTRKIISKQEVNNAAESLVRKDRAPTVAAIKVLLNSNSEPTIHKYLSQWKMGCFKNMLQRENIKESEPTPPEVSELERSLKLDLQKQIQRNEEYAQELIQAEKTIVSLKEENHKLQTANQELQQELKEVAAIKSTFAHISQEIQLRLELNENKTIIQQQQFIDELQAELKELNAKSMQAMQELSSSGHEVLMQERVISINLQAKIDSLNKELNQSHKQLELAQQNWQTQHLILQKQIKLQQKIIQTHLSQEKLQQLEQNGLGLLFEMGVNSD